MLRFRSGEATNCRSPRSCGAASRPRLGEACQLWKSGHGLRNKIGRWLTEPLQEGIDGSVSRIRDQGAQPVDTNFDAGAAATNEDRLPDRHRGQSNRRMAVENENPGL